MLLLLLLLLLFIIITIIIIIITGTKGYGKVYGKVLIRMTRDKLFRPYR